MKRYNVFIPVLLVLLTITLPFLALADNWPMMQRDMHNTGRVNYTVPVDKLNDTFFDHFLWQKQSPGSPANGNLTSTSMIFFDGVGPENADIVVGGYRWPKGVQGMNRHTGELFWNGNPEGGESIGDRSVLSWLSIRLSVLQFFGIMARMPNQIICE